MRYGNCILCSSAVVCAAFSAVVVSAVVISHTQVSFEPSTIELGLHRLLKIATEVAVETYIYKLLLERTQSRPLQRPKSIEIDETSSLPAYSGAVLYTFEPQPVPLRPPRPWEFISLQHLGPGTLSCLVVVLTHHRILTSHSLQQFLLTSPRELKPGLTFYTSHLRQHQIEPLKTLPSFELFHPTLPLSSHSSKSFLSSPIPIFLLQHHLEREDITIFISPRGKGSLPLPLHLLAHSTFDHLPLLLLS